jgi:quercetin dioxygenase-like cupin family protein
MKEGEKCASPPAPSAKATPLLTKPLAGIDGKEGVMLTVEYPPGVASASHRHNANTFVYVLEGSVVMQVAGGPEMTLTPGQTFYESPSDIHSVSRNASTGGPPRFS